MNLIHDVMTTIEVVLGAALAVSETLALVPKIKANSIFQLIWNILKKLNNAKDK